MEAHRPAILVTGSSGLLGRPVCQRLAEAGYEVFGFDRVGLPEPPIELPRVHDIECDLTNYSIVRGAVAELKARGGSHLTSVVHLAAYYDFSGEDSELYRKVTVEGTDRLLNALREFEMEQFIFSSTMLVHEPVEVGGHIDEHHPLRPRWPYPESKVTTEQLIRDAHPDVRSVFLRIAGIYTEWGTQPTLVQQIKRIYERDFESHFFPGDQDVGQSGIFLDDTVESILCTVERRKHIGPKTPILIGEADPPSYAELQDLIGRAIHGEEWTTLYVPPLLAKVGAAITDRLQDGESFIKPFMVNLADDHYALDLTRARELLDWAPKHQLKQVLPKIIDNLLANPREWYARNGLGEP